MNMDEYKAFLAAAAYGKFYKAAQELFITPATVSKHISALEKELGVALFERSPHGVCLTKQGETRLPAIRQMVESYELFLLPELEEEKQLTIHTIPPPSRFGLGDVIKDFTAQYPDIRIEVVEHRELTQAVASGECELGFVGTKFLDANILQSISIKSGRVGAVMHKDHRLAKRDSISLRELENENFILPNPEIGVHQVYVEYCESCGFTPHVSQMAFRDDSVLFYVSNKQGVSLFTNEMLELFNYKDIVFVPLQEEFYRTGALVRAKDTKLSNTAAIFWSFMKRRAKE